LEDEGVDKPIQIAQAIAGAKPRSARVDTEALGVRRIPHLVAPDPATVHR
jgi:hypothetical protein